MLVFVRLNFKYSIQFLKDLFSDHQIMRINILFVIVKVVYIILYYLCILMNQKRIKGNELIKPMYVCTRDRKENEMSNGNKIVYL